MYMSYRGKRHNSGYGDYRRKPVGFATKGQGRNRKVYPVTPRREGMRVSSVLEPVVVSPQTINTNSDTIRDEEKQMNYKRNDEIRGEYTVTTTTIKPNIDNMFFGVKELPGVTFRVDKTKVLRFAYGGKIEGMKLYLFSKVTDAALTKAYATVDQISKA